MESDPMNISIWLKSWLNSCIRARTVRKAWLYSALHVYVPSQHCGRVQSSKKFRKVQSLLLFSASNQSQATDGKRNTIANLNSATCSPITADHACLVNFPLTLLLRDICFAVPHHHVCHVLHPDWSEKWRNGAQVAQQTLISRHENTTKKLRPAKSGQTTYIWKMGLIIKYWKQLLLLSLRFFTCYVGPFFGFVWAVDLYTLLDFQLQQLFWELMK